MATVVGVDKSAVLRTTCGNCASAIEYTAGEVRLLWNGTDIGGGPDGGKGFSCPNCGKDIVTQRW